MHNLLSMVTLADIKFTEMSASLKMVGSVGCKAVGLLKFGGVFDFWGFGSGLLLVVLRSEVTELERVGRLELRLNMFSNIYLM